MTPLSQRSLWTLVWPSLVSQCVTQLFKIRSSSSTRPTLSSLGPASTDHPLVCLVVGSAVPGSVPKTISSHLAQETAWHLPGASVPFPVLTGSAWTQATACSLRLDSHWQYRGYRTCYGLYCVAFRLVTLWQPVPPISKELP